VVTAVGQLNVPRIPDIEGRDSFKGPSFHSARWRTTSILTGKRVAVIGTGASAFQFVPEIAPQVAHLTVFQRTPPWGLPVPHYHDDVPTGMKWLLEHVPYYDKWYRFWLFWMTTEGFLPMVKSDPGLGGGTNAVSAENLMLREMAAAALAAQVQDRPDLLANVIPTYPVGGKRAVLDNGVWLGALKRPNVDLVTEKISRITPKGGGHRRRRRARGRRDPLRHRLHRQPASSPRSGSPAVDGKGLASRPGAATRAPISA
jgi:4-hydroxyacetophenone monooxygenase